MLFSILTMHAEDYSLQVIPFKTTAGVTSDPNVAGSPAFYISMNNAKILKGLQFEIWLPEGMSIVENGFLEYIDDEGNSRLPYTSGRFGPTFKHTIDTNGIAGGYTRVMVSSNDNTDINGNSGKLLEIHYKTETNMPAGIYPIKIREIVLTVSGSEDYKPADCSSYVEITTGEVSSLGTAETLNMKDLTGDLPSEVVEELNSQIASNTSLRKLDLSGVTNLGAELVVPENALWYTSNAAKLNRTYSSGVKCTVCLPFSISASNASAMGDFYKFSGIEGGKVVMGKVTGDIEANTPYIFVPSSAQTGIGATSPSTLTVNFGASPQTENATDKFTFIGTYEPITWDTAPTGIYGFAVAKGDGGADGFEAGEFVLCGAGANIPAYRAYLKYTGEGTLTSTRTRGDAAKLPTRLPIIWRSGADTNVTGIETLDTAAAEESGAWYGLNGQRYAGKPSAKGIYVNNGKKVIVK